MEAEHFDQSVPLYLHKITVRDRGPDRHVQRRCMSVLMVVECGEALRSLLKVFARNDARLLHPLAVFQPSRYFAGRQ